MVLADAGQGISSNGKRKDNFDTAVKPASITGIPENILRGSNISSSLIKANTKTRSPSTESGETLSMSQSSRTELTVSFSLRNTNDTTDRSSRSDEDEIWTRDDEKSPMGCVIDQVKGKPAMHQNTPTKPITIVESDSSEGDDNGIENAIDKTITDGMYDLKIAPKSPGEVSELDRKSVRFQEVTPTVASFMAEGAEDVPVPTSVQIHRARDPPSKSKRLRMSVGGSLHRQVSFHEVQIRRYPMIAGDNPACQMGAPVTLDWGFEELPALDLDDFEVTRLLTRRRKLHHLILNYFQRRRILAGMGYSDEEIKKAEKTNNRERLKREITKLLLPITKIEEMVESLRRKLKRRTDKEVKAAEIELDTSIRSLQELDAKRLDLSSSIRTA